MITINSLEVRFEVEGEGDEAVFATMFAKYIRQWNRLQEEMKVRKRLADAERALGDRPLEELV